MKYRTIALIGILFGLAAAPVLSAQGYVSQTVTISTEKVVRDGKTYLVHPVMERQTLFGISKAYGVTLDDLYAANPGLLENGLKQDSTILVPTSETVSAPVTASAAKPAYREHTVMWYEDLDDIAARYSVPVEEIMEANGMKTKKVTKRQVLKIPVRIKSSNFPEISRPKETPAPEQAPAVQTPEPAPETAPTQDSEAAPEEKQQPGIFDWLTGKGSVDMALLLPFNAAGSASDTNMDFYAGVLMALRDLEAEGIKATLNVYDFQEGIPSAAVLEKNDFILGPVSTKDLTSVLERTEGRVPVISPLDQRAADLAESHKGFIQAPSGAASQYAGLAAWVKEEAAAKDRIVLVTEKVSGSTAPAVGIREALLAADVAFEGVSWTQSEGRSLPAALTARLSKDGVNRIVVGSEKEAFVSDLLRNLGILQGKGYEIVLYAPSRVRNFETVDGSAYHQCTLHICPSYFADYGAEEVSAFVRAYRALFRTEPSQFAFQGYDLTRFFAGLAAKYGNRWASVLDQQAGTGLQTDFRFEKAGNGSYRNTGIRRIIYKTDYSTELVR